MPPTTGRVVVVVVVFLSLFFVLVFFDFFFVLSFDFLVFLDFDLSFEVVVLLAAGVFELSLLAVPLDAVLVDGVLVHVVTPLGLAVTETTPKESETGASVVGSAGALEGAAGVDAQLGFEPDELLARLGRVPAAGSWLVTELAAVGLGFVAAALAAGAGRAALVAGSLEASTARAALARAAENDETPKF